MGETSITKRLFLIFRANIGHHYHRFLAYMEQRKLAKVRPGLPSTEAVNMGRRRLQQEMDYIRGVSAQDKRKGLILLRSICAEDPTMRRNAFIWDGDRHG